MTRLFDALAACEDAPLADVDRDPEVCRECGGPLVAFEGWKRYVAANDWHCGRCAWNLHDYWEDPE